jgi:hypothetical protein
MPIKAFRKVGIASEEGKMFRIKTSATFFAAAAVSVALHAGSAQAQLARTFVSAATGSDSGDCNRLTPCRTFQAAHDKTLENGEITVLDPGGYGVLTITKAISIINDGVGEAGMLVSGGAKGITINAPLTAAVSLRGLTIKGIGFGGGNGIYFRSGKSLSVENCVIRDLDGETTGTGLTFLAGTHTTSGSGSLSVSNTLLVNNKGAGISVVALSGTANVVLNRVQAYGNSGGGFSFTAGGGIINATVEESVAAHSSNGAGFSTQAVYDGSSVNVMITRSVSSSNSVGLHVETSGGTAGAIIRVGKSTVTQNTKTWEKRGAGNLNSFGDNYIAGNSDGDPAPSTIAMK